MLPGALPSLPVKAALSSTAAASGLAWVAVASGRNGSRQRFASNPVQLRPSICSPLIVVTDRSGLASAALAWATGRWFDRADT
jgi:hypothetical protein